MTYDNKGSFGELALLYNMPRAATVQVSSQQLRSYRSMRRSTTKKGDDEKDNDRLSYLKTGSTNDFA